MQRPVPATRMRYCCARDTLWGVLAKGRAPDRRPARAWCAATGSCNPCAALLRARDTLWGVLVKSRAPAVSGLHPLRDCGLAWDVYLTKTAPISLKAVVLPDVGAGSVKMRFAGYLVVTLR